MKLTTAACFSVILAVALATPARAQVKEVPGETVSVSGTVEAIDYTSRVLTLKDQHGELDTIDVPADVKRLAEIKVGESAAATPGTGAKPAGTVASAR